MLPAQSSRTIDPRRLRSFDGTEIAYHVAGASRPGAPWIVLANGLGGGTRMWRGLITYLGDRYRFATWDCRGLHASERPRPERPGAYSVASHVGDLSALLAAEGIERAHLAGWSLGVQVAIEAAGRLPGRVQSLVLCNGAWGRPLDALVPLPEVRGAILPFIELVRRTRALGPAAHRPLGRRRAAFWLKRLGLVGEGADDAAVADLTAIVARLDPDALLRNLRAFGEHDAQATLASIEVPTLVIAGDRDPITPRELAQQMTRSIAQAELLVVRSSAHATPIEYPELVSLRVERFYRENGL